MDKRDPFWYGPMLIDENIDFFCSPECKSEENGATEASFVIEECSELIKELSKINRNKHDMNAIASEMAHVYLSLANCIRELNIPMSAILGSIDEKYKRYNLKTYSDFGLEIDIPEPEKELTTSQEHVWILRRPFNMRICESQCEATLLAIDTLVNAFKKANDFVETRFSTSNNGTAAMAYIALHTGAPLDIYSELKGAVFLFRQGGFVVENDKD